MQKYGKWPIDIAWQLYKSPYVCLMLLFGLEVEYFSVDSLATL